MSDRPSDPRPRRPARRADLTAIIDAAGGADLAEPETRAEIAAATAAVVVRAGRGGVDTEGRFVDLADRVGLETLSELWREADPVSLPGALWALYLLRQWCRTRSEDVVRLWRAGEPLAPADAAVAGVALLADAAALARVADDVLAGAYGGDFAVALERAAALFRVLAVGRRAVRGDGTDELRMAERNERAAADLAASARLWRAGALR